MGSYVGGWVARSLGSWERLVPGKQVGRWLHGIGGQRGWVRVASVGVGLNWGEVGQSGLGAVGLC